METYVVNKKLAKIINKYSTIEYNKKNYSIGGGLHNDKFASRRHEDAKNDAGKLTLGQAAQLFKKATGVDVDKIKSLIWHVFDELEWHHAGKLPKQYGGGMKKTYFLNSKQIAYLAMYWDDLINQYEEYLEMQRINDNIYANKQEEKNKFLKENAKYIERVTNVPDNFYETNREMKGKYGWFESYGKQYNLQEYYSGWVFNSKEKYEEFKIKFLN
jgi:hypothetical protein